MLSFLLTIVRASVLAMLLLSPNLVGVVITILLNVSTTMVQPITPSILSTVPFVLLVFLTFFGSLLSGLCLLCFWVRSQNGPWPTRQRWPRALYLFLIQHCVRKVIYE